MVNLNYVLKILYEAIELWEYVSVCACVGVYGVLVQCVRSNTPIYETKFTFICKISENIVMYSEPTMTVVWTMRLLLLHFRELLLNVINWSSAPDRVPNWSTRARLHRPKCDAKTLTTQLTIHLPADRISPLGEKKNENKNTTLWFVGLNWRKLIVPVFREDAPSLPPNAYRYPSTSISSCVDLDLFEGKNWIELNNAALLCTFAFPWLRLVPTNYAWHWSARHLPCTLCHHFPQHKTIPRRVWPLQRCCVSITYSERSTSARHVDRTND